MQISDTEFQKQILLAVEGVQAPAESLAFGELMNGAFADSREDRESLRFRTAEAVTSLLTQGLLYIAPYSLESGRWGFRLSSRGQEVLSAQLAASSVKGMPSEIAVVWAEASACYPSRLRAAAILVGVAADMAVDALCEALAPHASKGHASKLRSMQASVRRNACEQILKDPTWLAEQRPDGNTIDRCLKALQRIDTSYAWLRDETVHRQPAVQPDADEVSTLLATFPGLVRGLLAGFRE
jgi:hypothetical protein